MIAIQPSEQNIRVEETVHPSPIIFPCIDVLPAYCVIGPNESEHTMRNSVTPSTADPT